MKQHPAPVRRALVAGLLVPMLAGCDGDDGTPPREAASTPAADTCVAPAGRQFGQRWTRPAGDAGSHDVVPASPHAGVYRGSVAVPAADGGPGSSDGSDSDADGEAVLLLGVTRGGRITGFVHGAPGIAAGECLELHGTIAHHQTSAPLLLSDRQGQRYGAMSLDFRRGGSRREVVATILRKDMAEITLDAIPLDGAVALDAGRRYAPRDLELQLDDLPPLRDAAAFELRLGKPDKRGAQRLHARGGGFTLDAKLTPTGVDGFYDARVHVGASAGDAPGATPSHDVGGQMVVERLSDGRLTWALIAAGPHARVLIDASEVKPAK